MLLLKPNYNSVWGVYLLGRAWSKLPPHIAINIYNVPATNYFLIYCFQLSLIVPLPTIKALQLKEASHCRRIEISSFRVLKDILHRTFPKFDFSYYDTDTLKQLLGRRKY